MSLAKKIAAFVIVLLMITSASGANAAFAADRTVLDADHVTETFEEAGAFENLTTETRSEIAQGIDSELANGSSGLPPGVRVTLAGDAVAEEAVSEEYIAGEFQRNVENGLAFLKGEASTLDLFIDLEPVRSSLLEQIDRDAVTVDTVALAQGAEFETDRADVQVTDEMIARMNDGPEGYAAVRGDVRQQVREGLPPRASEEDVDATLREINEDMKSKAAARAESEYGGEVSEETLTAVVALQHTVIDGLTDPDAGEFSAYESERDDNEAALEAALAGEIRDGVDDEFESQIDLSENVDEGGQQIGMVQSGFGLVDSGALLFALVFLGLAGALYALGRSVTATAKKSGYALIVAGIGGVVAAWIASGPVLSFVENNAGQDAAQSGFFDGFVALVNSLFDALLVQSVVLAVLGIVLFVAVYAESHGYIDIGGTAADPATERRGGDR